MANPFKKPMKDLETSREKFVSTLVFGLFIFLFLYLFKPFGMDQLESVQQAFVSFGFGMVTTFVLIILRYLIEPFILRRNWTLGKSIIWDLTIATSIGIANYFYINIIFHQPLVFKYLIFFIWAAILVGIIPVSISYIITFNRIYRAALKEAAIVPDEILWENEVVIHAGNPKNEFKINPRNIVYLSSNDNYVTIVTTKKDTLSKTTIRGTLKAAESELSRNSRFIRCHKCYIVNLDFVEKVSGHNQNMRIKLLDTDTEIPVSRSKTDIISKKVRK